MGIFKKKKPKESADETAFPTAARPLDDYLKMREERRGFVKTLRDFQVGQVWEMSPGYYTKNPYYIEILLVTKFFIVTNIPQVNGHAHIFDIRDQGTWQIQTPRMKLMGMMETHEKLLKNQPLS